MKTDFWKTEVEWKNSSFKLPSTLREERERSESSPMITWMDGWVL